MSHNIMYYNQEIIIYKKGSEKRMGSLAMRNCLVYPYSNFKERIRATKDIQKEIVKRYGKNKKYDLTILDGAVMVEFKSESMYH